MEGKGRRGEQWAWNSEKGTEKKEGGEEEGVRVVFSVRCLPGLNESTCFLGGCDMSWGRDKFEGVGGAQISSRDYFKEVCIVLYKL